MSEREWFEAVWTYRETVLYPSLFGPLDERIFPLSAGILRETFGQKSWDPRWLHHGVLRSAPHARRDSWLYVTSGLSNAWEDERPDPEGVSGLGCELVLETTLEGNWAIVRLLHALAFQILLAHGRFPGRSKLGHFDRIPVGAPVAPGTSTLTSWLVTPAPPAYGAPQRLESGTFRFLNLVGISDAETDWTRDGGTTGEGLFERLRDQGAWPATDPTRGTVTLAPESPPDDA